MSYLLFVALLRHYRFHPWQLFFILIGISSATCLLTTIDLLIKNSQENFSIAAKQLSGPATHHITSTTGWLSEQLYTELTQRFSVTASPVIQASVKLAKNGELYTLLAVDLFKAVHFQSYATNSQTHSTTAFLLDFIQSSPPAVIIAQQHINQHHWQIGDQLTLFTENNQFPVTLIAAFNQEVSELFDHLLVMDIGQAQQLLNVPGKLSRIDLTIHQTEQLNAIRQWLPSSYQLAASNEITSQLGQMSEALSINLSALALLVVTTGFFIVFNTVRFALLQRHQLLTQLTQLGITTQQKTLFLLLEVVCIAVIATLLGILSGILISSEIQQIAQQTTSNLYGITPVILFHVPAPTLIKAVTIGIFGPLAVISVDCWQASRYSTQHPRLQWQPSQLLGFVLLGGITLTVSICVFYFTTGLTHCFIAIGGLLLGYAAWLPVVNWLTAQLASKIKPWPAQLKGILWQYFWQDNQRHSITTSIAMMALVIALATAIGIGIMIDSFRLTVANWLEHRLSAHIYLKQEVWGQQPVKPLPDKLLQRITKHPAIAHIAHFQSRQVNSQDQLFRLTSSNAPPPMQQGYLFTGGNPNQIWQNWQQPNQLLISEPLAHRLNLKQHSQLAINTPNGIQTFRVAGIYYDYASEYGRALISKTNYQRYWPVLPITSIAVYLINPAQQQAIIQLINQLAVDENNNSLNLAITTPEQLKQRSLAIFDQTFLVTNGLRTIAIIIAAIGMASTLMALQLSRANEVTLLHQLGFTHWQINCFQVSQMLWFGCLCCLLALPVGYWLSHWLITGVNIRAFGWSMPLLFRWATSLSTLGFTLAAIGVACLYPLLRPPQSIIKS
ncbi:ABC transporter permease [Spartinivicinus poritis]|uniref:ABC transporter permease n=1 Tax=Spartinivicinus poritis TaxID=2994640 RepID=A0ABT5U765_9GAMM|nr:ABC transporter permease [Spartinivicinus sp. A2-2]MDE1462205.1 ABC transporter permease [Spartinivicinus sp. A2-2]